MEANRTQHSIKTIETRILRAMNRKHQLTLTSYAEARTYAMLLTLQQLRSTPNLGVACLIYLFKRH